jgi:hypothetical protein
VIAASANSDERPLLRQRVVEISKFNDEIIYQVNPDIIYNRSNYIQTLVDIMCAQPAQFFTNHVGRLTIVHFCNILLRVTNEEYAKLSAIPNSGTDSTPPVVESNAQTEVLMDPYVGINPQ